jgi:hypothetical protein
MLNVGEDANNGSTKIRVDDNTNTSVNLFRYCFSFAHNCKLKTNGIVYKTPHRPLAFTQIALQGGCVEKKNKWYCI